MQRSKGEDGDDRKGEEEKTGQGGGSQWQKASVYIGFHRLPDGQAEA